MGKITILQVIYGLKYGGAEKILLSLSAKLDQEKFRVIVLALTCSGPVEEELKRSGIDVRVLRDDGKFCFRDFLKLVKIIKTEKAAILHSHLQNADLWGGLAARICRIKQISTFHGSYFKKSLLGFLKQKIRVILPEKIIAVSRETADYCVKQLGANPDKVSVIYGGIDAGQFRVSLDLKRKRETLGITDNAFILGSFGRLEIEKGQGYLIEAIPYLGKDHPELNIVVLIAGGGSLKQQLMDQAARLEVMDKIRFLGERGDIPELLKIADIVVIPSLSEGLPVVGLEAMAAGKPVVATGVGGVPELIEDRKTGILVPPADPVSLAKAIFELARDHALVGEIISQANDKLLGNFTADKMVRQVEHLYEQLLAK